MNIVLNDFNSLFIENNQNYIEFCSKFESYKNIIHTDELLINEIMLMQLTMSDLNSKLQNINFKLCNTITTPSNSPSIDLSTNLSSILTPKKSPQAHALQDNTPQTDTPLKLNITMKEMIACFFYTLMLHDKNSILNSKTFMQKPCDNINNNILNINSQCSKFNSASNNDCCDDLD